MQKPHIIIDAGPGTGKTTTMVAGLNIMQGKKPEWYETATDEQRAIWEQLDGVYHSIGFQAFNKSIATELQAKVPSDVAAKTFHAFGYAVLREHGYSFKMSGDNVKFIVKDQMGYDKNDSMRREDFDQSVIISKLVSLCKNNLVEPTTDNLNELAKYNNIETNGEMKAIQKMCELVINKCRRVQPGEFAWIDFDDMIWLPITLDLDFSGCQYDLLICDESQDLNPVQHELVLRSGVRLICVGDPRQAIYGFRGADAKSMTTLKGILEQTHRGVEVLPLMTSFRLPKSGVRNVNGYAAELKALPDAIEGEILEQYIDEVAPSLGDLIVSRINANIFSLAFMLLKKRVPVRIQGREFGNALIKIIKDKCDPKDSIDAARNAIQEYDVKERTRLSKKTFADRLVDAHAEKISCLYSLTSGCETVKEMIETIETLFSEDLKRDQVVLLSTVHRAKGLEADTVYFLEPQLVPHPMAKLDHEKVQEFNLKFVAETRHKKTLVYVYPRQDDDLRDEQEGREIRDEEIRREIEWDKEVLNDEAFMDALDKDD